MERDRDTTEETLLTNLIELYVFVEVAENTFLLWYGTIVEANKNQPLITINMVKMYPVEVGTKVISVRQPHAAMSIPH